VNYPDRGEPRLIKFMHRDRHYINLDNRIPIIVAANGPMTIRLAAELADGWTTATSIPDAGQRRFGELHEGARTAQRELPADFFPSFQSCAYVVRPGESLGGERAANEIGSYVTTILHLSYETWLASGKSVGGALLPQYLGGLPEAHGEFKLPPEARFREITTGTAPSFSRAPFHHAETVRGCCWPRARRDYRPPARHGTRRIKK
jgi:hypothetical protein